MKKYTYFGILIAALLLSCSTSRITSTWKAENIQPTRYGRIMVLGLIHDKDRMLRIDMENHMVNDLKALGYEAVSSYQEYGPRVFEGLNEAEALSILSANGVDAVVTIVLLNKSKERYYVPARITYSPYYIYGDHFWSYYHTLNSRIYSPGYYTTETKYFWESNFYVLSGDKLLYSVQTQSFDPASSESLAHEYGQLIVKNMVKNNVLYAQVPALKAF